MYKITPQESFLIQSYALAECIINLGKLEASRDALIFDNVDRVCGQTGKILYSTGRYVFQGQGSLVSVFYMLLVLPFEWGKKGIGDFKRLDLTGPEDIANAMAVVKVDTYKKKIRR